MLISAGRVPTFDALRHTRVHKCTTNDTVPRAPAPPLARPSPWQPLHSGRPTPQRPRLYASTPCRSSCQRPTAIRALSGSSTTRRRPGPSPSSESTRRAGPPGPVTLTLGAEATQHLNSGDLERGAPAKGLPAGLGDGSGDWRLELVSSLDLEAFAYVRSARGFLTSMHDVVPAEHMGPSGATYMRHRVAFFNPGRNDNQVSMLRIVNLTATDNEISITASDDDGRPAPGGEVKLVLGPYEARRMTASALEQGGDGIVGRLGTGKGKWRLDIATAPGAVRPIQVMSLMYSRTTGNLANLSALGTGNDTARGGDGIDWIAGSPGDDVLDPGGNDEAYDGIVGSEGNDTIVYSRSGSTAYQWLDYNTLAGPIRVMVDGDANTAAVDKGPLGKDTIINIENPLDAAAEPPYGAFGLRGTTGADHFDLALAPGQWMDVRPEAGDDTVNIRSGNVQVSYRHAPGAVLVDLEAGRASADGYGGADTLTGDVYRIEGGTGGDTLLGTEGEDSFDGGPGDDTVNPRGSDWRQGWCDHVRGSPGNDRIVLTDSRGEGTCVTLDYGRLADAAIAADVDGAAGTATIGKGALGTDTVVDMTNALASGASFALQGSPGADTIDVRLAPGQWIQVRGGAGDDAFRFDVRSDPDARLWSNARLDYVFPRPPGGVHVDLALGRALDDGWGDTDTIEGNLSDVRGTDHADRLLGSDANETFIGRGGNDTIDGRGGYDQLRFDRSGIGNVVVDLSGPGNWGEARGTWSGREFTYRIANIERVRTGPGNDELMGGWGDDRLEAGPGSDSLEGGSGDDRLYGGGADGEPDFFVFSDFFGDEEGEGDDRIHDFADGEDVIVLFGSGATKAQVLANTYATDDGTGTWINLRPFGGGTITIDNLPLASFDEADLLL